MISIIAAIGKNRELGRNNKLLWHLKADMERFKKLTLGQVVVMGRKTFESLPKKFCPLPKRINIVVSRKRDYSTLKNQEQTLRNKETQLIFASSIKEAIEKAKNFNRDIFIAGGASIYHQTLPLVDKLYLTVIEKTYPDADVFFPPYQHLFFKIVFEEKKEEDSLRFSFLEIKR